MTDLLTVRTWGYSALRGLARWQNPALEKSHLTLIAALLAAWALDLGTLAVFLAKYHAAAAYSLAGAVLAVLSAAALLELRRRNRVRIARGALLPLALVHLAFLSAAAWLAAGSGRGSVIENLQDRSRIGSGHPSSGERSVDLSDHRAHTTGEVDAEDGIIRCCRRRIGQRQGGRVISAHQRYCMWRVGRRVGVVDRDGIAVGQVADVDAEAVLRRRRDRAARGRLVGKRLGHASGEGIELILRFHEILIAHLEIGRDGARPDRVVLN